MEGGQLLLAFVCSSAAEWNQYYVLSKANRIQIQLNPNTRYTKYQIQDTKNTFPNTKYFPPKRDECSVLWKPSVS